jgi:hypothetical protein
VSHPLKEAITQWYLDWWCKRGWHSWESIETDEMVKHGTLWGVPIESSAFYRGCTQCDKEQKMEWLIWRDVHEIPPARIVD